MPHLIDSQEPPSPALLFHRIHRATDAARRGDYNPATRDQLRVDALALALAAGLGDEHRLLLNIATAQAGLAAGDHRAGERVIELVDELQNRLFTARMFAAEALFRAQRDHVAALDHNLR